MRIIAVHLLNDFSGSPKVLMQLTKAWSKNNHEVHLYCCSGREGFLSDIPEVKQKFYWYHFAQNKLLRLLFLTISQLIIGFRLFIVLKKTDVLYINTVLPFGAALAGKLAGCTIIYHIHETSINPKVLKQFLFGIVKWTASEVVYVSEFLANKEAMQKKKTILYNVLENNFVSTAQNNYNNHKVRPVVLMICSLKAYKGVNEFVKLACRNDQYLFKLVVNASVQEIELYFNNTDLPSNLVIYPTQKNTHLFYQEASVLLNLSDTDLWVETFGLTVLEGMAYGLPAIVPPVGGVVELVEDGYNGFLIDSKNLELISDRLDILFTDQNKYKKMSLNAIRKSKMFNEETFEKEANQIISNC
jgi:L-malate glycosyltransferase